MHNSLTDFFYLEPGTVPERRLVERRLTDRRSGDRRIGERRKGERRATDRRSNPRRGAEGPQSSFRHNEILSSEEREKLRRLLNELIES